MRTEVLITNFLARLKHLNLSSNELGNKHIKQLLEWLFGNTSIKEYVYVVYLLSNPNYYAVRLHLADNKLNTNTGVELAKVLQSKGFALTILDVTFNDLGTRGTKEIIKALKTDTYLHGYIMETNNSPSLLTVLYPNCT